MLSYFPSDSIRGVNSKLSQHEIPRAEGLGWRVGVSIITFFGSMIATIVWLFFYASNFTVYQNIALVVVILMAFIAIMGATWAPWGIRQGDWKKEH